MEFKKCLSFVMRWEGGYVNDPHDAGGETKYGISKRAYPNEDIKNLTLERAGELYKKDYWDKIGADRLDDGLDCAVFDCAVNMGVGRAKQFLARASTWVEFNEERREYYKGIVASKPSQSKFIKGWMNRVDALDDFIEQETS